MDTRSLLRWEGFVEKVGFEPGVKSERVMDAESDDVDKERLPSE